MLNTRDALELYVLLKDYIPEELPKTLLEFTGKMIKNIRNSEQPENFGRALILMSGKSVLELDEVGTKKRMLLFIAGLRENYFLDLVEFCKLIGL